MTHQSTWPSLASEEHRDGEASSCKYPENTDTLESPSFHPPEPPGQHHRLDTPNTTSASSPATSAVLDATSQRKSHLEAQMTSCRWHLCISIYGGQYWLLVMCLIDTAPRLSYTYCIHRLPCTYTADGLSSMHCMCTCTCLSHRCDFALTLLHYALSGCKIALLSFIWLEIFSWSIEKDCQYRHVHLSEAWYP